MHNSSPSAKSTTERGYGIEHQRLRRQVAREVATGYARCWRCKRLIRPDEEWHLGHDDDDRSVYRGAEHARCNLRAGGKAGQRALQRLRRSRRSRSW